MKKVEIKLHGVLGKGVGRQVFNLAVKSVSEAIHAINILTSNKLNRYLQKHGYDKFNVVVNGRKIKHDKILDIKDENIYSDIANSELVLKTSSLQTIDIIPVVEASDSDIFAIILGVILILVGVFVPGLGGVGVALIIGGIGIAAAGVINLLSKPPAFEPFQEIGGTTKKSYLFNGPENVVGEGGPVPVGYGRLIVGSQTVSASYDIYNVPVENGTSTSNSDLDVVYAWYFRTSKALSFEDKIKKISYAAAEKTGLNNLVITGSRDLAINPLSSSGTSPTWGSTTEDTRWGLPIQLFVNYLFNGTSFGNTDPTMTVTINKLFAYLVTPTKNQDQIIEPYETNKYDIKLFFYGKFNGGGYVESISGGTFESLEKYENSGPSTILSDDIIYPYVLSFGTSYVTQIVIKNFKPDDQSFNIDLSNNGVGVPLLAVIVEKSIKTNSLTS